MNYPVKYNPAYNQQHVGLNGFFSWLRRAVNTINRYASPFIPGPISRAIDDFTNGDGEFFGHKTGSLIKESGYQSPRLQGGLNYTLDDVRLLYNRTRDTTADYIKFKAADNYEPTAKEQVVLDGMLDTFTVFILPYFQKLKIIKDKHPTKSEYQEYYNATQELYAYLLWLSENAVLLGIPVSLEGKNAWGEFLKIQADILKTNLDTFIEEYAGIYDFGSPVATDTTVSTSKYSEVNGTNPATISRQGIPKSITLKVLKYVNNTVTKDTPKITTKDIEGSGIEPVTKISSSGSKNKKTLLTLSVIALGGFGLSKLLK